MSSDPFFTLPQDAMWNACIGRQSDELHYLDGYIEAGSELAAAVIEKNMLIKRPLCALRAADARTTSGTARLLLLF